MNTENTPMKELLKESTNAGEMNENKENSSSELAYAAQYKDTPFWIRGNEKDGYFATMGNKRVSVVCETLKEVESLLNKRDWNIILNAMIGIFTNLSQAEESAK